MSAESVYDAIRQAIADNSDDDLSMFELIGVVRLIEAELIEAAMTPEEDEDEG